MLNTSAALLGALEHSWADIKRHHPDVPPAVIRIGRGYDPRKPSVLTRGHWAAKTWELKSGGDPAGEVMISGERLADGGAGVIETLLHEAAHGVAFAREIADTSRGGRYHNTRYRRVAQELALDVAQDRTRGWTVTTLTDTATTRYRDLIADVDSAIPGYRRSAGCMGGKKRQTRSPLVCGCDRKIYAAQGVAAKGPIVCGVCGSEFESED